jgi:hypothetical protein
MQPSSQPSRKPSSQPSTRPSGINHILQTLRIMIVIKLLLSSLQYICLSSCCRQHCGYFLFHDLNQR